LAAGLHFLSPPLAGSSTGQSPGAPERVARVAVEAPIHFPSQSLTAAPPTLARLLTDCPTYSLNPVLAAAISPTLAPSLAGSSTGPSPGAPEGVAPVALEAPIHFPNTAKTDQHRQSTGVHPRAHTGARLICLGSKCRILPVTLLLWRRLGKNKVIWIFSVCLDF